LAPAGQSDASRTATVTAPENLTVRNQIDNNARNANNTPFNMKLRSRFHVPYIPFVVMRFSEMPNV
jgi:hypothetical protein